MTSASKVWQEIAVDSEEVADVVVLADVYRLIKIFSLIRKEPVRNTLISPFLLNFFLVF